MTVRPLAVIPMTSTPRFLLRSKIPFYFSPGADIYFAYLRCIPRWYCLPCLYPLHFSDGVFLQHF